jgi:hypothetical protein
MDALKFIEKLAEKARKEASPISDVSQMVMLEIDALQRDKTGLLPLELFAGITAIAASIVTFFSIQAWQYIVNPLMQLFVPYQGVSLW